MLNTQKEFSLKLVQADMCSKHLDGEGRLDKVVSGEFQDCGQRVETHSMLGLFGILEDIK